MENYNDIIDKLSNWNFKKIVLFPEGSNYVFLVKLQSDKNHIDEIFAIYKPVSGERPLRDFPDRSLYLREKFAWIISTQLGWPNLPPLVIRDGPYGLGSLQFYVNSFTTKNYFTERDSRLEDFIYIAAFDVLVNNSDRKGSSCLIDKNDKLASETTREFHEWIHTGALYTLVPDRLITLKFLSIIFSFSFIDL